MVDWMRWLWWHLEQVWSPHCGRKGFWEVNFQWGSYCRWCRWHRTPPPIINHQSHLYSFTETRELYTCCWRTDFFLLTPQLLLTFWQKWYGCVWAVLWFDLHVLLFSFKGLVSDFWTLFSSLERTSTLECALTFLEQSLLLCRIGARVSWSNHLSAGINHLAIKEEGGWSTMQCFTSGNSGLQLKNVFLGRSVHV